MTAEREPAEPFPGADGGGVVPGDETVESEPLDLEDGGDGEEGEKVVRQQNVGIGNEFGSGEFPDRDAPPQDPAPGG